MRRWKGVQFNLVDEVLVDRDPHGLKIHLQAVKDLDPRFPLACKDSTYTQADGERDHAGVFGANLREMDETKTDTNCSRQQYTPSVFQCTVSSLS